MKTKNKLRLTFSLVNPIGSIVITGFIKKEVDNNCWFVKRLYKLVKEYDKRS